MDNVYATPNSEVTPEGGETHYSGFWIRVLAALIDTAWVVPLVAALGWLIYGAVNFSVTQGPFDFFLKNGLPVVLTLLFWYFKSATPGKMILGMKIVDANTLGKVHGGRLLLRYVGYYVSIIPLGLGILWVGWDRRTQGWHDKIAGTVVIREK